MRKGQDSVEGGEIGVIGTCFDRRAGGGMRTVPSLGAGKGTIPVAAERRREMTQKYRFSVMRRFHCRKGGD